MTRYAVIYEDANEGGSQCHFIRAENSATAIEVAKALIFGNPSAISIYGGYAGDLDIFWDDDVPMIQGQNIVSDAFVVELSIPLPIEQWQEELEAICEQRGQAHIAEQQVRQTRIDNQLDNATDDKLFDAGFVRWLRIRRPGLIEEFVGEHELERDPSVSPS